MRPRSELHDILLDILGTEYVYFQPPPTVQMQYPCIVYHRDDMEVDRANNGVYLNTTRYSVVYIDKNPDSTVPKLIAALPMCSYSRFYTANNLNHDAFNLFF